MGFLACDKQSCFIASKAGGKGRHRPNAITQHDAIFLFSKVNNTVNRRKFCKICRPNTLNC